VQYCNVFVYTDGACYNNGKLNTRCGSRIWFAPNDPCNKALRIPGPLQSNQISEIAAIIQATSITPPFCPLTILSDSKYAIEGLTIHLSSWEDIRWIGIKNADLFKRVAYLLKKRTTTTHFKWIKGHNGDQGNEECNHLTKTGANKPHADILDLEVPTMFDLQGAKLLAINQVIAY
jgi:ribonuclease HI